MSEFQEITQDELLQTDVGSVLGGIVVMVALPSVKKTQGAASF